MTTVILVRHGRTTANASGVLAGWTPGVGLDETGQAQAAALGERLAKIPLTAVVTSPLERCRQTADALLAGRVEGLDRPTEATTSTSATSTSLTSAVPGSGTLQAQVDDRVGECRYGEWTGRKIKELAEEPLWRTVQTHPSAARFPGVDGESLAEMSARAVAAVRDWNERLGPDATYVVCSHGDVIKAVLADALGLHLDQFQRIVVDPCSISVVRYSPLRPFVERLNDRGGDVAALLPQEKPTDAASSSDAVVGGGAGSES